jgi:Flp pilus assembly protein TadB
MTERLTDADPRPALRFPRECCVPEMGNRFGVVPSSRPGRTWREADSVSNAEEAKGGRQLGALGNPHGVIVVGLVIWLLCGMVLDTSTPLQGALLGGTLAGFGLVRLVRQFLAARRARHS